MFNFFKKKAPAATEYRVEDCLQRKDCTGLAIAYCNLSKAAMEAGHPGRAMLWLSRADTIYSAREDVYEEMGEGLTADCSNRIGTLEGAPLLSNRIVEQVEKKAAPLGDMQVRIWSLLTLSRLAPVGDRLSALPKCGVLGELGRCADLMMKSFQGPLDRDEVNALHIACGDLYALSDGEEFFAGGEVPCGAGAPLQVFDLNGLTTLLSIEGLLDGQLRCLSGERTKADADLIPCALLPDYWTRTAGGDIQDIPQVKAELERIWADYDFIRSGPTWSAVAQRVEQYKSVDIFA